MSERGPEPMSASVEALLDSVRTPDTAPAALRERALARARAALAVGAVAPRAKPRFASLGFKLAAAFVSAIAVVSAASLGLQRRHQPEPSPPAAKPALQSSPSAAPSATPPAPNPGAASADTAAEEKVAARPSPASSVHPAHERYALELKVLQPARAAVARADYSAALASIADHQRLFPDGQLSEEREALRVQALSGLGRNEAASRAASAFRKRFPGSVLLSRMQALQPTP